ncbi:MAG: VOC family protein [Anaerolineae bacterium]|nr:VOC family protein [Anaerolineae bacterium]
MIKIAVFGFYALDHTRLYAAGHLSPVNTQDFMRAVWAMEPPESRIGEAPELPCFVKLTRVTTQPIYVQCLSDDMAGGAGLVECDGYIAIIDAVKILAPNAIQSALRRLYELQPQADLIVAAGRQNEPDALSSDEIRTILGLNPDLLVMPYDPDQPATIEHIIQRMVRYIDNPDRVPPPIFVGDEPRARVSPAPTAALPESQTQKTPPPAPRIHGLDYMAIIVSDLDRALHFYQKLLGFRLLGHIDLHDERERTLTHLDTGRGVIALVSAALDPAQPAGTHDERQTGIPHLALRVTDIDAIAQTLRDAGVTFTREPVTLPHGVRVAFCTDPDGTVIELVEGEIVYTRR